MSRQSSARPGTACGLLARRGFLRLCSVIKLLCRNYDGRNRIIRLIRSSSGDTVESMEITQLNKPYVIQMGEEDGRLVQVTIRAVEGANLGYDEIREATRQLLVRTRREHVGSTNASRRKRPESEAVLLMRDAYKRGGGRVTDEYLARLAVAYEEVVAEGRIVVAALSESLDNKAIPTLKGHIMRSRQAGFLSPAVPGREGGEATKKAHAFLADLRKG